MFVSVMYYVPEAGGYGGKEYSYTTELPLIPYQKVLAPTEYGIKKAIVKRINLPEPTIKVKEIKELDI